MTDASKVRGRLVVPADRVPSAVVQHVAPDVVLDALMDPVSVVALDADAVVTPTPGGDAPCVHVTLRRIRRAIGHHAATVHHAVFGIADALVTGTGRIVRAPLVLQAIVVTAALVYGSRNRTLRNDRRRYSDANIDHYDGTFEKVSTNEV